MQIIASLKLHRSQAGFGTLADTPRCRACFGLAPLNHYFRNLFFFDYRQLAPQLLFRFLNKWPLLPRASGTLPHSDGRCQALTSGRCS